ncbi:MAG: family 31 glucosidase, partial [Actinomycetota bacterium]|nr:family 31 glucosidase [Actinomycetota bacterium]
PYLDQLWAQFQTTGIPPERPLWLAAPEAPGARTNADEWLLGTDVLVAPVLTQGATSRTLSFPAGCWTAPTGTTFTGPMTATVAALLNSLPYFTRCGTHPFGG